MLQNGQSLLLVSKRLGHATIATTGDIYGHLLPGWQKEAANPFAKNYAGWIAGKDVSKWSAKSGIGRMQARCISYDMWVKGGGGAEGQTQGITSYPVLLYLRRSPPVRPTSALLYLQCRLVPARPVKYVGNLVGKMPSHLSYNWPVVAFRGSSPF